MAALICFALELQNIELLNNHFGHLTSTIYLHLQKSTPGTTVQLVEMPPSIC